jgi:hypothetical protein
MSSTADTNILGHINDGTDWDILIAGIRGEAARGMAMHMRASEPGMGIGDLRRDGGRGTRGGTRRGNDEHGLLFLLSGKFRWRRFHGVDWHGSGQEMGGPGEWRVQGRAGICGAAITVTACTCHIRHKF